MQFQIPDKLRTILYIVFGVLAVAQAGLYAAYGVLHAGIPDWLTAGSAAFAAVTAAPFVIALLHIQPNDPNLTLATLEEFNPAGLATLNGGDTGSEPSSPVDTSLKAIGGPVADPTEAERA